jgi:anti-anti-sigma regulatory factor
MSEPTTESVIFTSDAGVVTATIVASNVEENAAHAILIGTQDAMDRVGGDLTDVVLDFGRVELINSSGLGVCFEIRNDASGRGARVILYRPTDTVMQLFMIVNMESLFTIVHNEEDLQRLVTSRDTDA